MASAPHSEGRLTQLGPDNHQPWLWYTHIVTIFTVAFAVSTRVKIKWRKGGKSDVALTLAHMLYIAYWVVLLLALTNSLGKSSRVTSASQEGKASKLLFASRILLVLVLALEKQSTILFIREVFTIEGTRLWFPIIAALGSCQALLGSLILSVGCSPGRAVFPGDQAHCSNRDVRWIIFTTFEAALEILLVLPVLLVVTTLQTNLQNKTWAIAVFLWRLTTLIPAFVHLTYFIGYDRHGGDVIDIVPSIVTEDMWVAFALISSSVPVLLRITKKFTTMGVTIITQTDSSNKTKHSQTLTIKMKNVTAVNQMVLRPEGDNGFNTIRVDAGKIKGEGTSIGSASESQVGILRQMDFDVQYPLTSPK